MSGKLKLVLMIAAGFIAFVIIGILVIAHFLQLPMHVKQEIARDILVSNDWTEVQSKSSLKIVRQFQSVDLEIDGAYISSKAGDHNLYLTDGKVINPEVQISDSEGKWYELKSRKYSAQPRTDGSDIMDIGTAGFEISGGKLPSDRSYRSIRIRSDVPFRCAAVIWQNYNLK